MGWSWGFLLPIVGVCGCICSFWSLLEAVWTSIFNPMDNYGNTKGKAITSSGGVNELFYSSKDESRTPTSSTKKVSTLNIYNGLFS